MREQQAAPPARLWGPPGAVRRHSRLATLHFAKSLAARVGGGGVATDTKHIQPWPGPSCKRACRIGCGDAAPVLSPWRARPGLALARTGSILRTFEMRIFRHRPSGHQE